MHTLTLFRVIATGLLLVSIGLGIAQGTVHDAYQWILASLVLAGIPLLVAATEPERLPENTRVPSSPVLACLASPWLPGGGRGTLFVLLHLFVAFAAIWCIRAVTGEATTKVFHIGVTCMSATMFVLGATALTARYLDADRGRACVRGLIAAMMLVCWILSGYLTSGPNGSPRELVGQILSAHAMGQYITNSGNIYLGHPASLPTLSVLVLASITGNVPRMVRGVREVVERSRRT